MVKFKAYKERPRTSKKKLHATKYLLLLSCLSLFSYYVYLNGNYGSISSKPQQQSQDQGDDNTPSNTNVPNSSHSYITGAKRNLEQKDTKDDDTCKRSKTNVNDRTGTKSAYMDLQLFHEGIYWDSNPSNARKNFSIISSKNFLD